MPDLIGHLFVIADPIGNLICTKLMFFLYI